VVIHAFQWKTGKSKKENSRNQTKTPLRKYNGPEYRIEFMVSKPYPVEIESNDFLGEHRANRNDAEQNE
jgi:hypothetical protein